MAEPLGAPLTASHPAHDYPLASRWSRVPARLPDGTPTNPRDSADPQTFHVREP